MGRRRYRRRYDETVCFWLIERHRDRRGYSADRCAGLGCAYGDRVTDYIVDGGWLQSLADDVIAIHTEGIFISRWAVIETYHAIGRRIATDEGWKKWGRGNAEKLSHVTELTGIGERDIRRAIQFYEKYPTETAELIKLLPDGKNISWHKVVNNLLPARAEENDKNWRPLSWYFGQVARVDYLTALISSEDAEIAEWARRGIELRKKYGKGE